MNRHPQGTRAGGRFAPSTSPESNLSLEDGVWVSSWTEPDGVTRIQADLKHLGDSIRGDIDGALDPVLSGRDVARTYLQAVERIIDGTYSEAYGVGPSTPVAAHRGDTTPSSGIYSSLSEEQLGSAVHDPSTDPALLSWMSQHENWGYRRGAGCSLRTPLADLMRLAADENEHVRRAAHSNPVLTAPDQGSPA